MSGHRKFSELTKDWSLERKRRIKAMFAEAHARLDREVHIDPILLEWSEWHSWRAVDLDVRKGGTIVPSSRGVYEAKFSNSEERLAIGKAKDLRMCVKQGLMRWQPGHQSGVDVLWHQDVVVRWAATERPAAVVEELQIRHKGRFGELPKYTRDD